jgi:WhiB family redox-sensing transcriptional regulator
MVLQSWDGAECQYSDPELWFPMIGEGLRAEERAQEAARDLFGRYCVRCPLVRKCLVYAVNNEHHHGIWAGTTPRQRRRIWKRRQQRQIA